MNYEKITTVARFGDYHDSEDEDGNYTGGRDWVVRVNEHKNLQEAYKYARYVTEYAADMGDGSDAKLAVVFWTESGEDINVQQFIEAAFAALEREE